jgi:hypothetical protein
MCGWSGNFLFTPSYKMTTPNYDTYRSLTPIKAPNKATVLIMNGQEGAEN